MGETLSNCLNSARLLQLDEISFNLCVFGSCKDSLRPLDTSPLNYRDNGYGGVVDKR